MKIFHLYSDWKWTGPAEPALNLCETLKKRGHDITFACGKADEALMLLPDAESVENYASERGLVPITKFSLTKHFRFFKAINDIRMLTKFINNETFDIIHVHRNYDHLVGGIAARRAKKSLPIVRTSHDGIALKKGLRNKICLSKLTDKLITVSEQARQADIKNYNLLEDTVIKIDAAIDCQRFSPVNSNSGSREKLRIRDGDVVVGIIARIQPHRRFNELLRAIKIASQEDPRIRLLVIGRGTKERQLLTDPTRAMGLEDVVIHTGYRINDYVDVVSCMDIDVFLIPGSDGSCRAVREVMAMGIPVISANRGMLPEIVDNNINGLVIDDTPENLADAILKLAQDKNLRKKMAEASLNKAVEKFSLEALATQVERVYEELLSARNQ
ncbi:MAG: glycosyltransferase family 4 protein [Candidatus Brocadiales bacterium]|nr:glycosyltransferase family 4 protein [Candidatus Brocadiales bacterium]